LSSSQLAFYNFVNYSFLTLLIIPFL